MKHRIEILKKEDLPLLEDLATEAKVDYPLNMECEYIGVRNGSTKLLGAIAINFKKTYPQFQHIVIRNQSYMMLGVRLIMWMENYLREKRYKEYVAYVGNKRNKIQVYALRIGLIPYGSDAKGVWYYKQLGGAK